MTSKPELVQWLRSRISKMSGTPIEKTEPSASFSSYDISSKEGVQIASELELLLGRDVPVSLIWDYPTIDLAAQFLSGAGVLKKPKTIDARAASNDSEEIAIIGMACRFPGARNLDEFRALLEKCGDAIGSVPEDRPNRDDFFLPQNDALRPVDASQGGFLSGIDLFDAGFFQTSRIEAENMDPQQRLLLEVSWEALENASIPTEKIDGTPVGVFIGITNSDYHRLCGGYDGFSAYLVTGNSIGTAASRISYFLNLTGPSESIDTACSSSLIAVHRACQSLRNGECHLALSGGVHLNLFPGLTFAFARAGMLSPNSRCRTFDDRADGYVRSEGCGVVVLKRASDALRDGDRIFALIRSSALNHNGRTNGMTSPSVTAQESLIRTALVNAQYAPEDIEYVESHGTGTRLGDAMELQALGRVFSTGSRKDKLRLGSVKANFGHMEEASGIAGLIKTSISLSESRLYGHPHFETLNREAKGAESTLEVVRHTTAWNGERPDRVAGVSSFSFSGTNCHVILRSPDSQGATDASILLPIDLFPFSAKSESALEALAGRYLRFLENGEFDKSDLTEICKTARMGRTHFSHRSAIVCDSVAALKQGLRRFLEDKSARKIVGPAQIDLGAVTRLSSEDVLVFYRSNNAFKRFFLECDQAFQKTKSISLASALDDKQGQSRAHALASIEYCVANTLIHCGVSSDRLIGSGSTPVDGRNLGENLRYADVVRKLSDFYVSGDPIQWAEFEPPGHRRMRMLPNYPFERQRFWLKACNS